MRFQSIEELVARKEKLQDAHKKLARRVVVCAGTGCVAGGAYEVYEELQKQLANENINVVAELEPCLHSKKPASHVSPSGCHGYCQMGPLVHVLPDDVLYMQAKEKDVPAIVDAMMGRKPVEQKLLYKDEATGTRYQGRNDIPFYAKQERIALKNCGIVDPESLDDYLANGGYAGLLKAFTMTGKAIVDSVTKSGLRGRGGAGFSTGRKWKSAMDAGAPYILCNGDEGDPGAFMDRSIMEGDPFKILEGMTIAAYAMGSTRGYIYVRKEYPLAVQRMQKAIDVLVEAGLLGKKILGRDDFSFTVTISRGGGAFVCGESTALMRSIEGKVGEPRAKYTRSAVKGLYDKPTVLNNVETWACVPPILELGHDWFASKGTKGSPGTKAFSLVGKVKNTGLIEVEMGTTLREIIYDIGGGIIGDKPFKAVQTGGPSGGCIPESMLDLPVDFDTLTKNGSMMGSGGMIVMDSRNCMVDIAKYFVHFLLEESCGKCTPCREGLRNLYNLVDQVTKGEAEPGIIDQIERVCRAMKLGSLCSLGMDAPNPVLSTIKFFRHEWEEHVLHKQCRAGVCRSLINYTINPETCTGCMICARHCPQTAITGEKQKVHVIDQNICDKCGICYTVCPDKFSAVEIRSGELVVV